MLLLHSLTFLCLSVQVMAGLSLSQVKADLEDAAGKRLYNNKVLNDLACKCILEADLSATLGRSIREQSLDSDVYVGLTGDSNGPTPGIQEVQQQLYNSFGFCENYGRVGLVLLNLSLRFKTSHNVLSQAIRNKFGCPSDFAHNPRLDLPACDRVYDKSNMFEEDLQKAFNGKPNTCREIRLKNIYTPQDIIDQLSDISSEITANNFNGYGWCKDPKKSNDFYMILAKANA